MVMKGGGLIKSSENHFWLEFSLLNKCILNGSQMSELMKRFFHTDKNKESEKINTCLTVLKLL